MRTSFVFNAIKKDTLQEHFYKTYFHYKTYFTTFLQIADMVDILLIFI